MEALWSSDQHNLARYDSIQPHYSLVYRTEYELEIAGICQKYGLGVILYSPLAAGFLTGKYRKDKPMPKSFRTDTVRKYMTPQNWALLEDLEALARARDKTISQIALGWLLSKHEITAPIIGPRTIDQLYDNLGAASLRLSKNEMETLEESSKWKF